MRLPLAVLVTALAWILWHPTRIHHDPAMYLSMGDELVRGAVPYVDLIELNPPLVLYLHAVPAAIARLAGSYPPATFLIAVWLCTLASCLLTMRVLRVADASSVRASVTAAALAVFSFVVLWRIDFGQREHLFALAFVPYLLLRCRRETGETPISTVAAFMLGCATGLAACVKPHFIAIAFAPELYWIARRRSLRPVAPEIAGFVLIGIAYGAHFFLLPADMRQALFDRWIPLVADGYAVYDQPMDVALMHWRAWVPGMIAGALVPVAARANAALRPFAIPAAIVALAGTASYLLQHKGWPHHAIPVEVIFYLVAGLVVGGYLDRRESARARMRAIAAMGASVVLAASAIAVVYLLVARPRVKEEIAALVASHPLARAIDTHSRPGDPVLFISTAVPPAYPILTLMDRRQGSRYVWDFMLPMLYRESSQRPGEPFPYELTDPWRKAEEARFRTELTEDIRARKPVLVVVSDFCQGCPNGFTLRDYLRWARFEETALSDYAPLEAAGGLQIYRRR